MDYYATYITLLGLHDSNLPPFRDARVRRYKSVKKMVDLIDVAVRTAPKFPLRAFTLDPYDPEWDDAMPFPTIHYPSYVGVGISIAMNLFFYAYNYNVITANIRFRTLRNLFPLVNAALLFVVYKRYTNQVTKVNLFDEYCWLRSQELVKQNEYLFKHQDFKKFTWWVEDFRSTLRRVYRQANDHEASDFKDSQLVLQDFVSRYTDPNSSSPMKDAYNFAA